MMISTMYTRIAFLSLLLLCTAQCAWGAAQGTLSPYAIHKRHVTKFGELWRAINNKDAKDLQRLVNLLGDDAEPVLNIHAGCQGRTLLHAAVIERSADCCKVIVQNPLFNNIDQPDCAGWTALYFAAGSVGHEHGECVRMIVPRASAGGINAVCSHGRTALHAAEAAQHTVSIKALRDDPRTLCTIRDDNRQTANDIRDENRAFKAFLAKLKGQSKQAVCVDASR